MSFWKEKISGIVESIDNFSDGLRYRWRAQRGYRKPLKIIAYTGFGTNEKFFLRGRVVAENNEITATIADNKRRNLKNFFRRFLTSEVPYARVRVKYANIEREVTADGEGYFYLEADGVAEIESGESGESENTRAPMPPMRQVEIELLSPLSSSGEAARATGKIVVPLGSAKFGVISDLDDTVITTNVTSKLKMLYNTAFRNEYTRLPFEGVAAFYRALQKGTSGADRNPFFYVSSSPWNLYPFLVEFLRLNDIPSGALFLKDFGNHTIFNSSDHAGHKTASIEKILGAYPEMPFILIGDDGESDPQIYASIVRKFAAQVKVIYIRSASEKIEKINDLKKLIAEVAESNVQLILARDTESAAVHAASENLIDSAALESVRARRQTDLQRPAADETL